MNEFNSQEYETVNDELAAARLRIQNLEKELAEAQKMLREQRRVIDALEYELEELESELDSFNV